MSLIRKNIKPIIAYTLFSLGAFILFLFLLFPREAIKSRFLYEIEKGTATEIKSKSDNWVFPLGLSFEGMEFKRTGGTTTHTLAHIDRLTLDVPVKGILSLSPVSVLTADVYGGSARGLMTLRRNNTIVQANWTNVDLSRIDPLKEIPAEITGRVSGDLVLSLTNKMPEGQIRLLIKGGKLGKIKIQGSPLPDIPVDELQGGIDIKGSTLSLKDIHFKNSDMKGTIRGDIQLRSEKGPGNLNISIRFFLGDKLKKEYQGLLSLIERSKDREGYYTVHIKGDLQKPAFTI